MIEIFLGILGEALQEIGVYLMVLVAASIWNISN